jgi:pentatricopeptide repeat protein
MIKEAEDLLDNAGEMGIQPTSFSYFILYKSYLKGKHFDKAESLIQRLSAAGIKLNEKWFVQSLETYALEKKSSNSPEKQEVAMMS